LAERLRHFGLEHPEKTRLIQFGRHAERDRRNRGQGPPRAFDFLGLTHISGQTREGKFQVRRHTVAKRMRARLQAIRLELCRRMHRPVRETGQCLKSVMTGYYRYHAVHGNLPMIARFRHRVQRLWRQVRRRRGNRKPSWEQLAPLFKR
jgi:RNA-directed DNA polymerase